MKKKLSISVNAVVVDQLERYLESNVYRNRSHIIELALSRWLEEQEK